MAFFVQGGLKNAILLYTGVSKIALYCIKRSRKFHVCIGGPGSRKRSFYRGLEIAIFCIGYIVVKGVSKIPFLYLGVSKIPCIVQGVSKMAFFVYRGLENDIFCLGVSRKCHCLYRGVPKMPLCFIGGWSRKCHCVVQGSWKCS